MATASPMYYFFFLPLGTDVASRRRPLLTGLLVAVNVVAYLLSQHHGLGRQWFWQLALLPVDPRPWTTLSACFLHADLFHLLGNMLYLVLFGAPLEDRLGRIRFLAIYLATGAAAMHIQAMVVMWLTPAFGIYPVIGASGAVAGLLGAFMIRHPTARVRVASVVLMLLHGVNRADVRSVNAVAAILLWMLLQLVYGLSTATTSPGVAYWAHLAGLGLGLALALCFGAHGDGRTDRHLSRGERYLHQGAWFAAAGEFEAYLRRRPHDAAGWMRLGRAQVAAGARQRGLRAYERAIGLLLAAGEAAPIAAAHLEMVRLLPGAVLPTRAQVRVVQSLLEQGECAAAVAALDDLAAVDPEHADAELARLAGAELRATVLGHRAEAVRMWRSVDARRLPRRWQRHLATRLGRRRAA